MTNNKQIIEELVNKFNRNFDEYKNPKFNEAQVRIEFVIPFWKALGWDVDNDKGEKASLDSTFEAETPTEEYIYGNKGTIKMHSPFYHTQKISLFNNKELDEDFDIEYKGNGYYHEIEEVTHCLFAGKIESNKLPHSISMNLITLLDQIKQKIGLRYDTD